MKTLITLALGLFVASGCTYAVYTVQPTAYRTPNYVQVDSAPPPLRVAVARPAQPRSNAYWVAGHWSWEGRWVWSAGQWQVPQPGYAWQEPVAVRVGPGYRYYPGYWHRHGQQPAPAYRQPGTIRVAVAPPRARGTVQPRRPARPGATVTVQPGRPARPGATVTVRPARPNTQRPGVVVQPATVRPARPNTQRPGVVVQPATVRPARPNTQRPGVVVQPATVRPARPNTQRPGVVVERLSCRVASSIVPRGGLLSISGSGLRGATVRIGGRVSPVVNNSGSFIQARATGGSGGAVSVTVNGQNAACGNVRVTH